MINVNIQSQNIAQLCHIVSTGGVGKKCSPVHFTVVRLVSIIIIINKVLMKVTLNEVIAGALYTVSG